MASYCVCPHVRVHVCMCACARVHVRVHACVHAHVRVCPHIKRRGRKFMVRMPAQRGILLKIILWLAVRSVLVSDDSFSALLRILPQLLRFCLLSLTHRKEIVRMSALKILKFILETQGCSLDASMIYILRGMFSTFPKTTPAVS